MTNPERKERRREAALKAARTRRINAEAERIHEQSLDRITDLAVNGPDGRQLLARAQEIGREADLWYHAHLSRWPTRPSAWTGEQRRAAQEFLSRFIRPDGTPQPRPAPTKEATAMQVTVMIHEAWLARAEDLGASWRYWPAWRSRRPARPRRRPPGRLPSRKATTRARTWRSHSTRKGEPRAGTVRIGATPGNHRRRIPTRTRRGMGGNCWDGRRSRSRT